MAQILGTTLGVEVEREEHETQVLKENDCDWDEAVLEEDDEDEECACADWDTRCDDCAEAEKQYHQDCADYRDAVMGR